MIILAGGASRRMGRDKSDLMIDGKTFLEMQIEKGEKLGISDIILSGYHGDKKYKYPVVTDRIPGKGPLLTIPANQYEVKCFFNKVAFRWDWGSTVRRVKKGWSFNLPTQL